MLTMLLGKIGEYIFFYFILKVKRNIVFDKSHKYPSRLAGSTELSFDSNVCYKKIPGAYETDDFIYSF